MGSARTRVRVSPWPPAVYGTMIVIGREGYTCAVASATIPKATAMVSDARTVLLICMVVFLCNAESDRHRTIWRALFAAVAWLRYKRNSLFVFTDIRTSLCREKSTGRVRSAGGLGCATCMYFSRLP